MEKNKKRNLYETVVQQIQQQIIAGAYKKGDLLPSENELARLTGVSRITVREALRLLSEMRLIETRRGIGSFVIVDYSEAEMNGQLTSFLGEFEHNFEQAIQIKLLFDPEIAKQISRLAKPADYTHLQNLLQQMQANQKNNQTYAEICSQFHLCLVDLLRLPLLSQFYRQLENMEKTSIRLILLNTEQNKEIKTLDIQQHTKILQSMQAGETDLAYLYTKEHLLFFFHYYQAASQNLAST